MRQSIHARESWRIGDPVSPARQPTPRNLSAPELAKTRPRSSWSAVSTFTQNAPDGAMRGQLFEDLPGENATRGGSSDRETNDWQVSPTGSSPSSPVTIVTPVQKWPRTARKCATSNVGAASDTSSIGSAVSAITVSPTDPSGRAAGPTTRPNYPTQAPGSKLQAHPLGGSNDLRPADLLRMSLGAGKKLIDFVVAMGRVVVKKGKGPHARLFPDQHGV